MNNKEVQEYKTKNIKVTKLVKRKGIFETEDGTKINYQTYKIEFQIGEYPLIFTAKVDKQLGTYIEQAKPEPVADSDTGSGSANFWSE